MPQALITFGPLIVIIGIMYFFMIRPQQKKEKEVMNLRANLKMGDEILTVGGVRGKIVVLKDDFIQIETGSNKSRIEFTRNAVLQVVNGQRTEE